MILEYLSKKILSGVRPAELEILQLLLRHNAISIETFQKLYQEKYHKNIKEDQANCALEVLQGKFVSNEKEYQKYENMDMISCDQKSQITRVSKYGALLRNAEFRSQVEDIIKVGLVCYYDKFMNTNEVFMDKQNEEIKDLEVKEIPYDMGG